MFQRWLFRDHINSLHNSKTMSMFLNNINFQNETFTSLQVESFTLIIRIDIENKTKNNQKTTSAIYIGCSSKLASTSQ